MKTKWINLQEGTARPENRDDFKRCVEDIQRGRLVIFPTETVYGLGGIITRPETVKRIYAAKGRPSDNPLIVHISDYGQLKTVVSEDITSDFYRLAEKLWPGPVTFIVKKSKSLSKTITGGRETVGVRFPANKITNQLIKSCGTPLAAPSANISGRPSPTRPVHLKEMDGRVSWIINSGPLAFGLESTIISLVQTPPVLLRPGPVTMENLRAMIPGLVCDTDSKDAVAPGMKYRHYSPAAVLRLAEWKAGIKALTDDVLAIAERMDAEKDNILILSTEETDACYRKEGYKTLCLGSRENLFKIANNLFHNLRRIDGMGYSFAVIEGFEERSIGLAIMNRIKKASEKEVPVEYT